ncbi:cellulose binding domain-containing protein [Actinacidiphila yeochonensis]|uniref:cellulose binding domain-containing protein n=1 Tax=Actinacidiphila yeochonensis TaxID=89050 RepID=UPI00389923F1
MTVTNTGSAAVNGWTIGWNFAEDQQISSLWNGDVTQSGKAVTVKAPSWGTSLAKGASVTVGFNATVGAKNSPVTAITLGGAACATASG